ncbi:MAG: hypothetical protein QM778_05995 [Myxococcales bacterium]
MAWWREVDEVLVGVALLCLLLGAAEAGFRLSRRVRGPGEQPAQEVSSMQGAVLGLLALLLGFTFSLAMSRFEARKELIRDEANAIGTFSLRTQLLPEASRAKISKLMRPYLETCVELQTDGYRPERVAVTHRAALKLQDQIWSEAMQAARAAPESEMMALLVDSLNTMIDLHGMQMAALRNRVPVSIFLLLVSVAVASLGLTGYASGTSHRENMTLTVVVSVLITAVIMLIFDLHRPARGLITVDLGNLVELRESLR